MNFKFTVKDLYRGISDFKKGYQPRTDIVKDEKHDLVTDCHKYFGWEEELILSALECIGS
jgi:hypothetical protein